MGLGRRRRRGQAPALGRAAGCLAAALLLVSTIAPGAAAPVAGAAPSTSAEGGVEAGPAGGWESLLPLGTGAGWSARFVPSRPAATRTLGHLLIQANLWNLSPSARGAVLVRSSPAGLSWSVQVSGLCPLTAASRRCAAPLDYVNGYPDTAYGQSPYGGPDTASAPVALPARLDTLAGDVWVDADYAIVGAAVTPMDLEYDLWLTPQPASASSPGPRNGIELELRLYQTFVLGALTRARFRRSGAVCLPAVVGRAARSLCWHTYYGPSDSAGGTVLVIFVPERLRRQEQVAVDVSAVARELSADPARFGLGGDGCRDAAACSLDLVELGTEFAGRWLDRARVEWSLSAYCIGLLPSAAAAEATCPRPG